jgi:hypothetical protein
MNRASAPVNFARKYFSLDVVQEIFSSSIAVIPIWENRVYPLPPDLLESSR